MPDITLATLANNLEIEPLEANRVSIPSPLERYILVKQLDLQVFSSIQALISATLCSGLTDKESIGSLLPGRSLQIRCYEVSVLLSVEGFNDSLTVLLSEIITENM